MKKNAIVIGSGVGGLAIAIRLAHKNYNVTILEKNSFPGGKLSEFWLGSYRFDAGPSLFTRPDLVKELLELGGSPPEFHYKRLNTLCRYFWEDGSQVDTNQSPELTAKNLEQLTQIPAKSIVKHLERGKTRYELSAPVFLDRPFPATRTILSKYFLKGLLNMPKLNVGETMHSENLRELKHPKLVQLFDRYATYNGSNPYKAPATLLAIPYLEYYNGAYLPQNGMFQITQTLLQKAKQLGATFIPNSEVLEIITDGKVATGVRTAKQNFNADIVVSNADVYTTFEKLIPKIKTPKKVSKPERSTSALVFNWGVSKSFPMLDLHNIFFSENYEAEFKHLAHSDGPAEDPTIYLFISSKVIPGDAPQGHENWFTMVNVPARNNQNWEEIIPHARKNILNKLTRITGINPEPFINEEFILDPNGIESRSSAYLGALYGNASNHKMAAFSRYPNKCRKIQNLYFTGGTVHPGGGIPLCLSSAAITANLIPTA
jgi:diapolycopene oxygenase